MPDRALSSFYPGQTQPESLATILAILAKHSYPEQLASLKNQGLLIHQDRRRTWPEDAVQWSCVARYSRPAGSLMYEFEVPTVAVAQVALAPNQISILSITLNYISLANECEYDWFKTYTAHQWQAILLTCPQKEVRLRAAAFIAADRQALESATSPPLRLGSQLGTLA